VSGENGGRPLPSPGTPPDEGALTGVLADYLAGLLDDTPEGDAVTERIAAEPAWADAYAELRAADAAVRADLDRYLTGDDALAEQTIPDDVAARLDSALAAAAGTAPDTATGDAAVDTAAVDVAVDTAAVVPLDSARRGGRSGRRRPPRWVTGGGAIAAGVVVLAAAALGAGSLLSSQDSPSADSAAPAGRAEQPAASPRTDQGDDRGPTLSTSATDYSAETVGGVALEDVAPRGPKPVPGAADANEYGRVPDPRQVSPELRRLASSADLNSCLDAIGGTTISAEYASFDGNPALIVVVADDAAEPSRPTRVVVVGPDCGLSGTDEVYSEDVPR
jgi:hypothetical protein